MSTTQSVRCNEPVKLDVPTQKNAPEDTLASLLEGMLQRLARRFEVNPVGCTGFQQETLIALWLCIDSAEPRVSLQTWLYSVAKGVGVRHVLENRAEKLPPGRSREPAAGEASLVSDPEAALANRARVALLRTLLDSFGPREREAAFLDLQQFEPHLIAEKLRCSAGQAQHLLVMAQRRLQLWVRQRPAALERAAVSLVRLGGT